ncbi:Cleavage and polyadenylation specificity factor subunit 1 [Irineochytrium annulatum]|nr:Cleavage and polyadenylation specificity factor subunit 1 [Irineochytrium annulatum]
MFVGSRVSDSLLIQIAEFDGAQERVAGESGVDGPNQTQMDIDDDDDDDLYGDEDSGKEKKKALTSSKSDTVKSSKRFRLRVCDSLLTTGPIRDMSIGEPAKYFDDTYSPDYPRRELEIVACAGEGAGGSLGIFHRNLRPKIVTTVELPEVKEVWAVRCAKKKDVERYHSYLFLSKEYGTTILENGDELHEIEGEFYRKGPTVVASSILNETHILQIHPNGILLFDSSGKKVREEAIGNDDQWIVSSSIADPYVLLLMNVGDALLVQVDEGGAIKTINELKDNAISACCIYADDSGGKLVPTVDEYTKAESSRNSRSKAAKGPQITPAKRRKSTNNFDDEDDDDLYGNVKMEDTFHSEAFMDVDDEEPKEVITRHWCFMYREDGVLEVFTVPDLHQVFFASNFANLPQILGDEVEDLRTNKVDTEFNEIIVLNLGRDATHKDPYLLSRTSGGDLVIYKAYTFYDPTPQPPAITPTSPQTPATPLTSHWRTPTPERLSIRFIRVPHDHLSRDLRVYTDTDGDKLYPQDPPPNRPSFMKRHYLKPFGAIGNPTTGTSYAGVVMAGSKPCWVMAGVQGKRLEGLEVTDLVSSVAVDRAPRICGKRTIRVHPFAVDGAVRTFTEFHNVNVQNGFVYVNEKGELRLCQLFTQFNYDSHWPFCKVPLKRTPHHITYHYGSDTYVLAASTPVPFLLSKAQHAAALSAGVIEEGETLDTVRESSKEDRSGLYYPMTGATDLELVSPVTWETVDRFKMLEYEHVLSIAIVSLHSKFTTSGRKLYLACGTGWFRGEDLSVRGRLLLFDVIDVVPEIDNPQTRHKFKMVYSSEEKTPITAVCGVNGYLLAALGSRVILYTFEDGEDMSGVAFIDVNLYVNTARSVKNMILLGDVMKSVLFIGFQEEPPQLKLLGKDYHPLQVFASDFIIHESSMSMIVSDNEKNIHMLSYAPYNIQSELGQRLLRRGEIHVATRIQSMTRLRKMGSLNEDGAVIPSNVHFCVCGTLDGGIALCIPVSEKIYKRTYALYSKMVTNIQHLAGLNPRGFRQGQQKLRPISSSAMLGPPGPRMILDGDLLYTYLHLSGEVQKELAKAVGSTVERIVDDLIEMMSGTEYF